MPENNESVLQTIDDLRPEMIEFTQRLIAIPTENPPGNHYERCATVIAHKLNELGLTARLIQVPVSTPDEPSAYCVLVAHGDGQRVLHFHGHYDVVPRSLEGQFEAALKGSRLFGRGSSDMKSGLASMIYAVHALRRAKVPLKGRVELVIVPD